MKNLFEHGKWLGAGGAVGRTSPVKPSPYFRKSFQIDSLPEKAEVYFCGLGYSELYLNGRKVDDGVLQPVVTQYDKRAGYLKYDVTELLQQGDSLLIFPEGTRREDNNIGEFRSGMALLSDLVPGQRFIPVYLEGLSRTLPKGEYLPAPNMSKLFFGAPLLRGNDESRDDFILRCRKALQDLSGEVK